MITICGAITGPGGSCGDHGRRARQRAGSNRLVWRYVFFGVGIREVTALAAEQSAETQSFRTAFEHCDIVTAVLCGISDPAQAPRSICAMGHKWMWNAGLGGLPSEEFLTTVDPLLGGARAKLDGCYATSDKIAGISLRYGLKS